MSETNRLQAQRPCANDPLFLPAPLKGGGAFVAFGFRGKLYRRAYRWLAWGKASVVTEWKEANLVGWNGVSRFGFEYRVVVGEAKGERNETAGWHERNGMNGSTLAWVAEAGD